MNKEAILEKSRKEKPDEGMLLAENRGRKLGISVFCGFYVVITVFNLFTDQSNNVPTAMFWAYIAAEALPKYQFTKNKTYLIITISGFIAALAALLNFIIEYLGR